MPEIAEYPASPPRERILDRIRPRAAGLLLALLLEALLLLLLLTLGTSGGRRGDEGEVLTTISASDFAAAEPATEQPAAEPRQVEQARVPDRTEPQSAPLPVPPAIIRPRPDRPSDPVLIQVPREEMQRLEIPPDPPPAAPAPSPAQGPIGPPDRRSGGGVPDTARVGTAPNGQPLYAAAWYREPRDGELRGYLSTAQGPGWGLIACRTVPDYRVEDCVMIDEYPAGSNIARSALAAAWQFRVRPPRVGGRVLVGEWVRIRIDYEVRRQ